MRQWKLHLRSDKSLEDLCHMFNPILSGWIIIMGGITSQSYTRFSGRSSIYGRTIDIPIDILDAFSKYSINASLG